MSDRLVAPREHLGALVEPEADAVHALLETTPHQELRSARLLDTTIATLRAALRRRLELTGPVIVTGHQAEFFHAGVFAKTLAVDALRSRFGGSGVFLTVDSDVPKTTRLTVPYVKDGEVRRAALAIPACDPRLALECQPSVPAAKWRDFFTQIATSIDDGGETLLPTFVEGVFAGQPESLDALDALQRGQAAVERSLGAHDPYHLRMSRVSEAPEFRAFVAHLMLDATGFAAGYNAAQARYRERRRERSPNRPVPPLLLNGDRAELPFWVWRAGQPRRRLLAAVRKEWIELFADQEAIGREARTRLERAEAVGAGLRIEQEGWHLRPRALTLSAFMRLFVSDLFVHGIGGARYDEMTEDFVRRFFGVALPAACCVTATAYLPLPRYGVDRAALAAARHARRDLRFNPQRHLTRLPRRLLDRRERLVRNSKMLRREHRSDRAARRRTFEAIRALNQELLRSQPDEAAVLEERWAQSERHWRSDRAALDREYFFALHPRRTMEELKRRIGAALGVE